MWVARFAAGQLTCMDLYTDYGKEESRAGLRADLTSEGMCVVWHLGMNSDCQAWQQVLYPLSPLGSPFSQFFAWFIIYVLADVLSLELELSFPPVLFLYFGSCKLGLFICCLTPCRKAGPMVETMWCKRQCVEPNRFSMSTNVG